MRWNIIQSIIKKDLKETFRNPQSLIIVGITVGINVFMSVAVAKPLWVMTFAMALVMVGFTLTSFIVMEEKEKKTLEALMVSPANYNEILVGKLFLTVVITYVITVGLIFSLHYKEVSVIHTLLSIPFGALIICSLGMVLGLICPSQAVLSGIGTVLMLGLFLPEVMAPLSDFAGHVARALPTHHVVQISRMGREGLSLELFQHYGILALSLGVTFFWVVSFVKTSAKQEGTSWKYEKSNFLLSLALLVVFISSSIAFKPIKGLVRLDETSKQYRYISNEYKISVFFDNEKFNFREYRFQDKLVVRFSIKENKDEFFYLSMKKNSDQRSHEEDMEKVLKKLKENEVWDLRVERVEHSKDFILEQISYTSTEGRQMFFLFNTNGFLYRLGLEEPEKKKTYDLLSRTLEKTLESIQFK